MDTRRWISPDMVSPQMFADWKDGRDPAMAMVLAHTAQPVVDPIAMERTFYYERPSQKAEWKPFWK